MDMLRPGIHVTQSLVTGVTRSFAHGRLLAGTSTVRANNTVHHDAGGRGDETVTLDLGSNQGIDAFHDLPVSLAHESSYGDLDLGL